MPALDTDSRIFVLDTTLRDGEQSPGATMNLEEKMQIAEVLCQLKVDVIECGFPASSEGDFKAVRAIAEDIKGPTLAALSRCQSADIIRTQQALKSAHRSRIHIFLATSPIHREYKLKKSKSQVIEILKSGLNLARNLFDEVEFSAEDAARTEIDFLTEAVYEAIEAGATVINVPDTVGFAVPSQISAIIHHLKANVPNIHKAVLSVHCHDDLGMATANTLAAVEAGARQVECTINGIGERAGNCALEELVMALRTRQDYFKVDTQIEAKRLYYASQMLTRITGLQVQKNKAVVGANAFAHEAGVHQHGVMMHPSTYEIMRPEHVGRAGNNMVLGKHSGRHAFNFWMEEHGVDCNEMQFEEAFTAFKRLYDYNKHPGEGELLTLVRDIVPKASVSSQLPLPSLSR